MDATALTPDSAFYFLVIVGVVACFARWAFPRNQDHGTKDQEGP